MKHANTQGHFQNGADEATVVEPRESAPPSWATRVQPWTGSGERLAVAPPPAAAPPVWPRRVEPRLHVVQTQPTALPPEAARCAPTGTVLAASKMSQALALNAPSQTPGLMR